jgi:uncharacterized protein YyaL (SSP411 family)
VISTLLETVLEEYEEQEGGHDLRASAKGNEVPKMSKKLKEKSLSEYSKPRSVQAIGNEFDKSQEGDEEEEDVPFKNMQLREPHNLAQKEHSGEVRREELLE